MSDTRMEPGVLRGVLADPQFQRLVARRGRLRWLLTAAMLVAYFGYIGVIAFDKAIMARKVGTGAMSVGIPVGLALIAFTILITGVYVVRANGEFDRLTRQIVERASR
uniref:DUF485 domain-containing protein n=1 Tax=Caulobacter sp. (strain K31) TaxID=366602 RepID=B0SW92_CAUSK